MIAKIVRQVMCFFWLLTAAFAAEEELANEVVGLSFSPPVFGDATGLYRLEINIFSDSRSQLYSARVMGKSYMLPLKSVNERVVALSLGQGETIRALGSYASFDLLRHRLLYPEADFTNCYNWSYVQYFRSGRDLTVIPPQPKGYDRLIVSAILDNNSIRDAARSVVLEDIDRLADERRYLESFWKQMLVVLN